MEFIINNLIDGHHILRTSFHHNYPYNLLPLYNGETKRQISLV